MQIRVREKNGDSQKGDLDSKNLQQGFSEPRKSAPIKYVPLPHEEKIEVFIREVVRVNIGDLPAVKHSFEEWAKQWD